MNAQGEIDIEAFARMFDDGRVRIAAMCAVSNISGVVNPIEELGSIAKNHDALVVVDAAQAMRTQTFDLGSSNCDFLCFSGHKMCGPTGIGVLCGKEAALSLVRPSKFGGGMVDEVTMEKTTFSAAPFALEGGTPNIQGAIGLSCAVDWLFGLGIRRIGDREERLMARLEEELRSVEGVNILGAPSQRAGAVSVSFADHHPYDVSLMLDGHGVATRSGHHCAQPHLAHYGLDAALRFSPAFYNTEEEIDATIEALRASMERLGTWRTS